MKTAAGGIARHANGARIPSGTLDDLSEIISAQHELICRKWKEFFLVDSIEFYC